MPRTQRHGRAPRTLTLRGPSPCLAARPCARPLHFVQLGQATPLNGVPLYAHFPSIATQPSLQLGPGPKEFSTDSVHSPVDNKPFERVKMWKNLCNKSGKKIRQLPVATCSELGYYLCIRRASRWSRKSGQPGLHITEIDSESSNGMSFSSGPFRRSRSSSEVRGITSDAVVAAELRMTG